MDGVLYTVADYIPCLQCADVRLVEQVIVAELTDEVRAALADGSLPDPTCEGCGNSLALALPILLATTSPDPAVIYSPPEGAKPDLQLAGSLLPLLRERFPDRPPEFAVRSRAALRSGDYPQARHAIPPEFWERPTPPPLPRPGPERLHSAWDELVTRLSGIVDGVTNPPAMVLQQLARAHVRRYQALGEPDSLEAARMAAGRAFAAADTAAERATSLNVRAAIALRVYERHGDAELLREAVAAYREALDCDPSNAIAGGGLGSSMHLLAEWDDDRSVPDEGIDALRRAVAAPGGERAVRLNNLGSALSSRWEVTHDPRDLTEAAVALTEAVELTPDGSPDASARLNNLGTVHLRAYRHGGGPALLEAAIDAHERAVSAMARGDPEWPGRKANLAVALWQRDAPGDRDLSMRLLREAADGHGDDPAAALRAAVNWCRQAFDAERWTEVTEAYERALEISDLLLGRQLTGEARRSRLRAVQGLPDLAAFAWASGGDGLAAALAIETGRARLLADALERVAADVEALAPALAARREQAVRGLELAERTLEDGVGAERSDAIAAARRGRAELDAVMAEVNAILPARDPLTAMTWLARHGPLVYVAVTSAGAVAAVVAGEPLAADLVWAPELCSPDADLATVGDALAARLAPRLAAYAGEVVTFSLPAALARQPLAAAPYGAGECLMDRHVTAVLPAAAIAAPAREQAGAVRLGGAANPARTDVPALAFAASELRAAAACLPAAGMDLVPGAKATVDDVLAVLGRCTHLHFACHGRFRADAPLESCLLLADGELSLRRMQRVEHSADLRLLVLSACESAQSDTTTLPDELIGLPTAFLQLGAQAVVGALWPVPDLPTQVLMARFYRHLVEEDLHAGRALRLAQNWMRTATTAELAVFLGEVASGTADDRLLGAAARVLAREHEPGDRPFAARSIWAAFVLFGTTG